ncbi:unnamed protein product [Staurois parvus]|uniref:Uncharacterized protein n=1 Tax=Staurois parvus TaxID=386267 RepID=A0ABN9CUD9_9NEOB|nr:unnamed protein product [Staurois parvus]
MNASPTPLTSPSTRKHTVATTSSPVPSAGSHSSPSQHSSSTSAVTPERNRSSAQSAAVALP